MKAFQILYHGTFQSLAGDDVTARSDLKPISFQGFYTSRIIDSADVDAAIVRGSELIRQELESERLRGRTDIFVALEVEEWREVDIEPDLINKKGFTFY